MKILLMLLFPLCLSAGALAQNTDSCKRALGLFAETNSMFSGNGNAVLSTVGLQYNKWNKNNLGYRIILGYGSYDHTPQGTLRVVNQDTAIRVAANTKIDMVMIGGGIQAQRQFYKKLYFFAGLEVRTGYGSGTIDTTVTREYNAPQVNPYTGQIVQGTGTSSYGISGIDATMFYVGLTPYFGLKLEFKRFCLGTEFKNYFNFTSIHQNSRTDGLMDFDVSNISQSFFLQYKF